MVFSSGLSFRALDDLGEAVERRRIGAAPSSGKRPLEGGAEREHERIGARRPAIWMPTGQTAGRRADGSESAG